MLAFDLDFLLRSFLGFGSVVEGTPACDLLGELVSLDDFRLLDGTAGSISSLVEIAVDDRFLDWELLELGLVGRV